MNEAGVAPPGVMPSQQPIAHATHDVDPVARQFFPSMPHDLRIDLGAGALESRPFLHGHQDLADAEQADDRDQKIEAVEQVR